MHPVAVLDDSFYLNLRNSVPRKIVEPDNFNRSTFEYPLNERMRGDNRMVVMLVDSTDVVKHVRAQRIIRLAHISME